MENSALTLVSLTFNLYFLASRLMVPLSPLILLSAYKLAANKDFIKKSGLIKVWKSFALKASTSIVFIYLSWAKSFPKSFSTSSNISLSSAALLKPLTPVKTALFFL
jgi:hypothetical protein